MAYRFDATKIRPIFKTRFKSVRQLALAAGEKYHTVQRAIHGGRIHYRLSVLRIANALGINAEEYLI